MRKIWSVAYLVRGLDSVWSPERSVNFACTTAREARTLAKQYLSAAIARRLPMHGVKRVAGFRIRSVQPNM